MNPWEEISLSDYENHMSLESVYQLQVLNAMMKNQIKDYDVDSLVVLGVAGGNGLEYTADSSIKKVFGIDINHLFLKSVEERYGYLGSKLECLCVDIIKNPERLPKVKYVIANLFLEYVGYDVFINALHVMDAEYVSCIIQVNKKGNWVSDSPYEKCFDKLNQIHHFIDENDLRDKMQAHGYVHTKYECVNLPNGKQLIRDDYRKSIL